MQSMRYCVIYAGRAIGETRLEVGDPTMGIAFGAFLPFLAYELVRSVFRRFAEVTAGVHLDQAQLAEYYRTRDALGLSLAAQDGSIIPTDWIHIVDAAPWGAGDELEVEVHIAGSSFFASSE